MSGSKDFLWDWVDLDHSCPQTPLGLASDESKHCLEAFVFHKLFKSTYLVFGILMPNPRNCDVFIFESKQGKG